MPICERAKYSLVFSLILAAALWFPFPEAHAEQSLETGVAIQLSNKVTWDEIVAQQLERKTEQDRLRAEAIEKARQAQIEAARAQEQARQAQLAQQARKVRQTAPKRVVAVQKVVSYANSYSRGQCTFYVASQRNVPSNWGNAREWLANARAAGWVTGNVPRVGAIAWTGAGRAGHVAIVRAVTGSQILVQEMNYNGVGVVSSRVANASEFVYIY